MDSNGAFEIPEKKRIELIRKNIVAKLSSDVGKTAGERSEEIVDSYVGQDLNALSVLAYAAERGRFDEFAQKLEDHYEESLQFVHPVARKRAQIPGAFRAEKFFMNCYESLEIEHQQ